MKFGQLTARFMCAAVVYDDSNHVIKAAPILKYMVGWTEEQVAVYCTRRKFHYESFNTESED